MSDPHHRQLSGPPDPGRPPLHQHPQASRDKVRGGEQSGDCHAGMGLIFSILKKCSLIETQFSGQVEGEASEVSGHFRGCIHRTRVPAAEEEVKRR